MKDFFYLKALRKTIIQFLDVFNNIRVAKYDAQGNVTKYVNVPIKLAGKDKIWYWAKDMKQDIITPMMAAQLSGITHAQDRAAGRHEYINTIKDDNSITRYLNPVPYDLDFTLSVLGQYMVELDQILEQILAYFNPYIFMKIDIPELQANYEVKVVVGSAAVELPVQMAEEENRLITWNIPFTVQTYLFRPSVDIGIIKKIYVDFYLNRDTFNTSVGTETEYTSGGDGNFYDESIFLEALGYDEDGRVLHNYEIFGDNI